MLDMGLFGSAQKISLNLSEIIPKRTLRYYCRKHYDDIKYMKSITVNYSPKNIKIDIYYRGKHYPIKFEITNGKILISSIPFVGDCFERCPIPTSVQDLIFRRILPHILRTYANGSRLEVIINNDLERHYILSS